MKTMKLLALAATLFLLIPTLALATDAGETQPKLSDANINGPNTSSDVVPTTSGHAGNLKGIACLTQGTASLDIYVDGGSAQTFYLDASYYPGDTSNPVNYFTGWIPMNVRFATSLRVRLYRGTSPATYYYTYCTASYAFD